MNLWFVKIQGISNANEEINYRFGFYVNCIIASTDTLHQVENAIVDDLRISSFENIQIEHRGRFEDFYWDEPIQSKLENLAKKARKKPESIFYDDFHIWKLE